LSMQTQKVLLERVYAGKNGARADETQATDITNIL